MGTTPAHSQARRALINKTLSLGVGLAVSRRVMRRTTHARGARNPVTGRPSWDESKKPGTG
jgi:hypothetical protein